MDANLQREGEYNCMMNRNFIRKNISSLIRPSQLITEIENSKYGKFELKPLERGFGLTLGNSLRRILLSSVQGTGLIAIKLEGVWIKIRKKQYKKITTRKKAEINKRTSYL